MTAARRALAVAAAAVLSAAGCHTPTAVPSNPLLVVRAYLFAGEPVTDVQVTWTLDLGGADTVPLPVNDAGVTLVKQGKRYPLALSAGDSGFYHYPGTDLTVAQGDTFDIEVTRAGGVATGRTVVPAPPDGIALSAATLVVPAPPTRGGGPGTFDPRSLVLTVKWPPAPGALFFVTVENIEADPQPITGTVRRARFISQPTPADSFVVGAFALTHLGRHRVRVYRVNQEYAQLYASRQQDSRDLNEPVTNIRGALGVFSAFNSRSAEFTAVRQ